MKASSWLLIYTEQSSRYWVQSSPALIWGSCPGHPNGRSMEAEVRAILRQSLADDDHHGLGTWIHERFAGIQLDRLEVPSRTELPRFIDFDET